jgi:hypothetical protein
MYLIEQGLNVEVDEFVAELPRTAHDVADCAGRRTLKKWKFYFIFLILEYEKNYFDYLLFSALYFGQYLTVLINLRFNCTNK